MSRKQTSIRGAGPHQPRQGVLDWLYRPVDSSSLVVLRIIFGALIATLAVRLFVSGDFDRLYLAQTIRFKYPLLGWLPDPSPAAFRVVLAISGVSGFLIAIGLTYRWACTAFFLSWSYVFFVDFTPYQNHDYLICLLGFLFLLMPLNRTASVDVWLRPGIRLETIPAWCLYILRFQISVVYLFGGIRKLNPDWLQGEPIRMMLHTKAFEHPFLGRWFFEEPLVMAFAWGGLLFDLAIVPALLWRRTRVAAFVVVLLFHLMNALLWDIDVFPWFMIGATLLFFPPEYPRRIVAKLRGSKAPIAAPQAPGPNQHTQKALAVLLAVYVAIQVALPCRPFMHPGHPLEQPDLLVFSWNMMLRVDSTQARFVVVDNDTRETWKVEASEVLSKFQMGQLGSPDALHQIAQRLSRARRREGRRKVSVFAHVRQSVHGRAWQIAVNPAVDLATMPRTIGVKPWVLPFETRVPPDPSARTAFAKAEWEFCRREGFLPLQKKGAANPEIVARVRAWEAEHQASDSNEAGLADTRAPDPND